MKAREAAVKDWDAKLKKRRDRLGALEQELGARKAELDGKALVLAEDRVAFAELEGEGDVYPAALSGGMARRLALARCAALGGEVLLLDEPFAGVDRTRTARLLDRLRGLGVLIVLATHQPQVLAACDAVIALEGPPLRRV